MDSIRPGAGQTSDTRLIERALRERWPVRPEWREAIVRRLMRVIGDETASVREVTSAARALLQADAINLAASNTLVELQRLLDQIRQAADNSAERIYDWGRLSVEQLRALTDLGALEDGDFYEQHPTAADDGGDRPRADARGEGTMPEESD